MLGAAPHIVSSPINANNLHLSIFVSIFNLKVGENQTSAQ